MTTIDGVLSSETTLNEVVSSRATLDDLPIELVWYTMDFLRPQDWLSFMLSYRPAYKYMLNPIMTYKYRSRFITLQHEYEKIIAQYNEWYYIRIDNGKAHGLYRGYKKPNGSDVHIYKITNYRNGVEYGWKYLYWYDIHKFRMMIDGGENGIYIEMDDSGNMNIGNYMNNRKHGIKLYYDGDGKLIKVKNYEYGIMIV